MSDNRQFQDALSLIFNYKTMQTLSQFGPETPARLTHEAKEHESNTTQGGYQGEHPLIEIRGSGVYVTEVKLRSNFSLRLCRPGAKAERQPSGLFAGGESEAEAQ